MTNELLARIDLLTEQLEDYKSKNEKAKDKIKQLQEKNKRLQDRNIELVLERDRLKELCDKYEEEHSTTFEYWKQLVKEDYKSRNEKANTLLNELLERAYIDGEYIMYDYSTSELLEVKQALEGEDKDDN